MHSKFLWIWPLLFFFGALWGSFFYTLALRYISGEIDSDPVRALFSRSRCKNCGIPLSLPALIPILGYFIVLGKCKACKTKISITYPLAEVAYGLLCVLTITNLGLSVVSIINFIIIGLCIAISLIDLKLLIIPDPPVIAFLLIALYPVFSDLPAYSNLWGGLGMFGFFFLILILFPGSFGGGDVKLATVIGFYMGIELTLVVMEIALISGSLAGVAYALITKKGLRIKFPFAPFLTLGMIISLLYGRKIILLYQSIF